jgi:hypothetical protein
MGAQLCPEGSAAETECMKSRQKDPIGNAIGFIAIVIVTAWITYYFLGAMRQNNARMAGRAAESAQGTLAPQSQQPGLTERR